MIRQIGNECIKFVKLKYGYVYIVMFFIISIFSLLNDNTIRTAIYSEEEEKLLAFYYEKWGGTYDASFETEINMYYMSVNSDKYSYRNDSVIPKEIREKIIDNNSVKRMLKIFNSSYVLAKNNEYTDEVVDTRGHRVCLRSYENIDVFFVIITMIMTCLIFSVDKQRGQEDIVKGTRYGNKAVVQAKIALVCLLIIGMSSIKVLFTYIPVIAKFNLDGFDYKLQNVAYMHNVVVDISICEALVFLVLCEVIGLIFANLVCAFVIVSNKGTSEGLICGFAVAYVPYFLLNKESLYKKVPLPSAYLTPYNFLTDIQKYKMQYIVTVCIVVIIMIVISRVYTYGFHIDRRRMR